MGFFSRRDDNQRLTDQQAVDRYRYMLRTAPPELIEQAHAEAFARLTPEQRRLALQQLAQAAPAQERRYATEDPNSLARLATRAEMREPGILERLFASAGRSPYGGFGGGAGLGSMLAGSLLASVAGTFIGSAIAHSFLDDHPVPEGFSGGEADHGALDPQGLDESSSYTEADYEDPDIDGGGFDEII